MHLKKEYNVTDLSPQSLYNLAITFESDTEFRHKFLYNIFSGGTVMKPSDYDTGCKKKEKKINNHISS